MEIFKELTKKGYKYYYEGTIEELNSMDKDNPHLHSEIMQVIMWLYEKHRIWIVLLPKQKDKGLFWGVFYSEINKQEFSKSLGSNYNSPTEAYEAAIEYCLTKLI